MLVPPPRAKVERRWTACAKGAAVPAEEGRPVSLSPLVIRTRKRRNGSDPLHVTVEEMCHHVRAVGAAKPRAHIVADMPWLSYHVDRADSVRNAGALIRAGAQ